MIPDVSQALAWLEEHPQTLQGVQHGLGREALHVDTDDTLATTGHPLVLGSALTHKWTTTDFAEALLKSITPVDSDVEHMLIPIRDIHHYTTRRLGDERMWPLSMPCYTAPGQDTELTQYGTPNVGRLKTLYREGLKNRCGALMQTISGVYYNFSLSVVFWQAKRGVEDVESGKEAIPAGYLRSIRNYYRFGWVTPYLFGASPAICSSFLQGKSTTLPFEEAGNSMYYLLYAAPLYLSDPSYANKSQSNLEVALSDLYERVTELKRVTKTPSEEYAKIGLQEDDEYLQINSNILRIENEPYTPIRPRHVTRRGETPSDALLRGGIEYTEACSLDISPFLPIGVDAQQVRFLDLSMVWCAPADTPEMGGDELLCTRADWNQVILGGHKPGLTLGADRENAQFPLTQVGKDLFRDSRRMTQIPDGIHGDQAYQQICDELLVCFDDLELTFSARTLCPITEEGIDGTGRTLTDRYRAQLWEELLEVLSGTDFIAEHEAPVARQEKVEAEDSEPLEALLAQYV